MNMIKQSLLSYWWKLRIKEQLNPGYPVQKKEFPILFNYNFFCLCESVPAPWNA
jgi:hypothetical protein